MHGKSIMMMLCTLICFSCHGQNFEPMTANIHKKLYPYLGANDLYGYADLEGNILIEPQYVKVSFFQNNVAIVQTEGEKEKLIDPDNQQIPIPLKYDELRQHSFSHHTIIELTETYTNRWRFWEWRFLPDFSFFGSPRRNRLFDTGVMREKRSLYWLEGRHKIQSKKGGTGNGDTYFYLNSVSENVIQVDDKFYRIENQAIKRIVKNIKIGKKIDGDYYLQRKGSSFQLIDSLGSVAIPQKIIPELTMELDIEGIPFTLTTESRYAIYHKSLVDLYSDGLENTYVYPDFSKKFPKKIQSYPFQDSITASEILKNTQSLVSIRGSDRFLLVFGKKIFALDTTGNWQNPKESIGKITVVSRVGDILWPNYHDELGVPSLLDKWRITSFRSFDRRDDWYEITIRKEEESLKGLWDKNTKSWIMPPEYRQIGYRSFHGRFLSFQIEKEGKWGLYDIQNQKVHIPPTYNYISESGWVHLYEGKSQKQFYLDIENKREFRKN